MTNNWTRLLLCALVSGESPVWAIPQDDTNSMSEIRTVTGCLSKSGSGNEYLRAANDGSTGEIHETTQLTLASHGNQTVEAKGVVSNQAIHNRKEDAKQMGHDTGMKNNTAEHGHLKATDVHKVSDSCQ